MDYDKLLNYLERKTADKHELQAASAIIGLRQRVQELEKEPSVESGGEFKTWWEIALHVGAWKNHELDYVHFGSEMAVRAFAIHLLKQRDKEESQLIQTIAKLTAERDALKQQRDELLVALVNIQQVACSGSPELGISSDAIASVKEKADHFRDATKMVEGSAV